MHQKWLQEPRRGVEIQEGNVTDLRNPGPCVPWDGRTKKNPEGSKAYKQLKHG